MRFDRLDAALEGRGQYDGKAYFFREGKYVRYDWKNDREDLGYPLPLTSWRAGTGVSLRAYREASRLSSFVRQTSNLTVFVQSLSLRGH